MKDIAPLVRQLQRVRAQAERLGIFPGGRELLECPRCGLKEDVDINGRLITFFGDNHGSDTGLRFAALPDENFRCPKCRSEVRERHGIVVPRNPKPRRVAETKNK